MITINGKTYVLVNELKMRTQQDCLDCAASGDTALCDNLPTNCLNGGFYKELGDIKKVNMSTYDFEPNPDDYGPEPARIANPSLATSKVRQAADKPTAVGCKCSVCGEWQRWTPSGMCCKNGHGGVPGVNTKLYTVLSVTNLIAAAETYKVERDALAVSLNVQTKAADHWMSEACRDHNRLALLQEELVTSLNKQQ